MSCESWWLYALLREETVILSFVFGTKPHKASADDYPCIIDDMFVLASVYCLD